MDSWLHTMAGAAHASEGAEHAPPAAPTGQPVPHLALLDYFFPGFSGISSMVLRYLGFDLNVYIPLALLSGGLIFVWRYLSEYIWDMIETHLMSTVEVRGDPRLAFSTALLTREFLPRHTDPHRR
jgi:hypothetical protein